MKTIEKSTAILPHVVATRAVDDVLHLWYESEFKASLERWIPPDQYDTMTRYLEDVLVYKAELTFQHDPLFHTAIMQAERGDSLVGVYLMRRLMARDLVEVYVRVVDYEAYKWLLEKVMDF